MQQLLPSEVTTMLLALAVLLGTARLLGELAQRWRQPAVLGELLAGVLLGPTVLGTLAPDWHQFLFPATGTNAVVLSGISSLAIVLFLMVAGLEVNLSTVWSQGQAALKVGIGSLVAPFAWGLLCAAVMPRFVGREPGADPLIFALFFATALSISALPVIAKTLMDLNLYRTELGMVIVSAAMFNDLIGWTVFAVILGMLGSDGHGPGFDVGLTILLTLLYAALMLTVVRWLFHRLLPYLQAYTHWPGGVLGFVLTLALLGAAFTEYIGIHAIFGAFLVGVAIGDSSHLREHSRVVIDQFVSFIFAPVFFASIGLHVNFLADFDFWLTAIVLVIACIGKLAGAALGARWARMPTRERWAVGFAMNARGAMEIILGLLALQAGLIGKPLFVALVVMALVTSIMSGPVMRWVLGHRPRERLVSLLSAKRFARNLTATSRQDAIRELMALVPRSTKLDHARIEAAVWEREQAAATGIGNGVAIPRAQIAELTEPLIAVGLSEAGVDFDAPDGKLAQVLFLMITPADDPEIQLDLLAEVARLFADGGVKQRVLQAQTYTEFIATLRTA